MCERSIAVVSHCILNQNVVVHGLERAVGAFPFVKNIPEKIGLVQLPCPEFLILGPNRPSMTYKDYLEINDYRQKCGQLLASTILELKGYQKVGIKIIGLIGIAQSPNCGITGQRGVFMTEFLRLCQDNNIKMPYIEVPIDYPEDHQFEEKVNLFLKGDH
ncbi:CD3072 family TudS-related putative desulfidase [Loigolactobacillus iwatensis]|uniref:CD3072 family TudS-related putative desulfidase n=1 Tax=Loigolactobacillus iwatensis TaxID=1267156 RepID=UPI000F7FABB6|nr:CD3072 family TudS-related putative desulfidase [Loigolactobacillus iwatensis]